MSAIAEAPPPETPPEATPNPGPKEFSPSGDGSSPSLREAFEKHATPDPNRPAPKPKPAPMAVPPKPPEKPKGITEDPPEKPAEQPAPPEKKGAAADKLPVGRPAKTTPQETWKTLKQRAEQAEARIKEYESQRVPEQERQVITKRLDEIQKRNQELENEIRFTRYEKSAEFAQKYNAPYEKAWTDALTELSEVPVIDPASGQQRAMHPSDLEALLGLPLPAAQEMAKEKFGEFAPEVMQHRKAIRDLLKARNDALEDARKNGASREETQKKEYEAGVAKYNKQIMDWAKDADTEWAKDPDAAKFEPIAREDGQFTPEEKRHNELVERGKQLLKEAWAVHPKNAKDPAAAREIVRKRAATAKRAEYFGVVRHLWHTERARANKLQKELDAIRGTTPGAGGGRLSSGAAARPGGSAVKGMFDSYAGGRR